MIDRYSRIKFPEYEFRPYPMLVHLKATNAKGQPCKDYVEVMSKEEELATIEKYGDRVLDPNQPYPPPVETKAVKPKLGLRA